VGKLPNEWDSDVKDGKVGFSLQGLITFVICLAIGWLVLFILIILQVR